MQCSWKYTLGDPIFITLDKIKTSQKIFPLKKRYHFSVSYYEYFKILNETYFNWINFTWIIFELF